MNINKYLNWLFENQEKKVNFYVLIGPSAVGKTQWRNSNFKEGTYYLLDRDEIILNFFKNAKPDELKFSNKHLYNIKPEDDQEHPLYGKVKQYRLPKDPPEKIRRSYEKIDAHNQLINKKYNEDLNNALAGDKDVIIDGLNSSEHTRKPILDLVRNDPRFKKIAVYFPHKGHEKEIMKRAEIRAAKELEDHGPEWDRGIAPEEYPKMFDRIIPPKKSEGFDEIIIAGDFKDTAMDKEITSESLTLNFRNWINKDLLNETSVSQLAKSHNIPKKLAKHVKSKCSNLNSDFILKIFLKNYKEMIENMTSESATEREKMLSDNYLMEFDRFMGYVGKTLDEYLKKHRTKKDRQEILELCEAGWPKFLKKMSEYKKESLQEVRLNKTWKARVRERAKRNGRDISPEDKKWAKKRLQDWNKQSEELEEAYLNEIEAAMNASKASKVYLEKLRALRKQKLEAKKIGMVKPTPEKLKNRKKPPPRSTADQRGPNEPIKGPDYAGSFGPLEELELEQENGDE